MFVKVTKFGPRRYMKLVDSYRDEAGKSRQRVIATLGRLEAVMAGKFSALINGLLRVSAFSSFHTASAESGPPSMRVHGLTATIGDVSLPMQAPPMAARWSRPAPTEAPQYPGVSRVRRLAVRHHPRPRASRDEAAQPGWMLHLLLGTQVPSPTRGSTFPGGEGVSPVCTTAGDPP